MKTRATIWILSVLWALGCGALWVRGYFRQDEISYTRLVEYPDGESATRWSLVALQGGIVASRIELHTRGLSQAQMQELERWKRLGWPQPATGWQYHSRERLRYWNARFQWERRTGFSDARSSWLIVGTPWWPIMLPAALPLAFVARRWVKARQRRMRLKTNHCVKCGYDLRATPDRCPECGTVVGA